MSEELKNDAIDFLVWARREHACSLRQAAEAISWAAKQLQQAEARPGREPDLRLEQSADQVHE